ncbi:bombyxin A-3 homolog [Choristoneura fumiferana]|uniref:bombyxin A-3 homolog n=1 Tax=Choristoneura fumiferana TaxID=7141 RepID=UPI003D154965
MKPQAFGVALVTLAILTACSAHIGGGQLMQELNPKIFCGRNLAIALAELCSFQNAEKRGDAGTMYNIIVPPYYKDPEHYSWPWLAPHHAHGLSLPNRGKRLTGIVNECCDKPCNIDEMLSYC